VWLNIAQTVIDLAQTVTLIWALFMVRYAFLEGIRLLRESLERIHAIEKRLDERERHE
jgi:hypothetical protein